MQAAKWERILIAAGGLFGRYGFRKTSMDEIARAAGVAKGTLYLGCTSKRDLFYQTLLRDFRLWNAELADLLDPGQPADQLLRQAIMRSLQTRDRHPLARDLILGVFDGDIPDWAERLASLREAGLGTLMQILAIGMRQGRFRAELDLAATSNVVLDMLTTSIMYHSRGADAEGQLERHVQAVLRVMLGGVLDPSFAGAPRG